MIPMARIRSSTTTIAPIRWVRSMTTAAETGSSAVVEMTVDPLVLRMSDTRMTGLVGSKRVVSLRLPEGSTTGYVNFHIIKEKVN
jgi:hypothetical protein